MGKVDDLELNLRRLNKVEWKCVVKGYKPIKVHAYFFNSLKENKVRFEERSIMYKKNIEDHSKAMVSEPTEELRKLAKETLEYYEKDLLLYADWDSDGTPIMFDWNYGDPETRGFFTALYKQPPVDVLLTMQSKTPNRVMPNRVMVETGKRILAQIREELSSDKTSFKIEEWSTLYSSDEPLHKEIMKAFGKPPPFPAQH